MKVVRSSTRIMVVFYNNNKGIKMAILWSYSKRQPEGKSTHIMAFGRLGTGPYSISYNGTKESLGNFSRLFKTDIIPEGDAIYNCLNFVSKGDIGWGICTTITGPIGNQTLLYGNLLINLKNPDQGDSSPITISGYNSGVKSPFFYDLYNPNAYIPGLLELVNTNIMAAGTNHFLIYAGSTLYAWGNNQNGQCNVPTSVHSTVQKVSAGSNYSLALLNNNSLTGWGINNLGQLNIPGGLTAIDVASGINHNIALKNDGTVVCWGDNTFNQCSVPVGLTGVTYIAAGNYHTMVVKTDGSVLCWGLNSSGQCNSPTGITNGYQIAGGSGHTILLKSDGTVIGWGDNSFRQTSGPRFPEPLLPEVSSFFDVGSFFLSPINIENAVAKVSCTNNATLILQNGIKTRGHYGWLSYGSLTGGLHTFPMNVVYGKTAAAYPSGVCFYVELRGYTPGRHDLYSYNTYASPQNLTISGQPVSYNTNWWISGSTTDRKLHRCYVSGYDSSGTYKSYDFFSPVDFSGCSLRPRQMGAPWLPFDVNNTSWRLGYAHLNDPYVWQYTNSGFWSNILITKKHAIASKHYAGPNINLYNVEWMRRDGIKIRRNLQKISDLNFTFSDGSSVTPDMILYELDSELTTEDLKHVSVYNILPKLSGFTGSKTIDTVSYIWKGITGTEYNSFQFMSKVGRRLWYLDGQDKVYAKSFIKTEVPVSHINYNFLLSSILTSDPYPSNIQPDDVSSQILIGDSGTPVFITAANRLTSTESREASYFVGSGTTWGRTMFLGLFDAGAGEWKDEFIQKINDLLVTRGLTGNDLLQKIDVDSVGPGLIWTAPVSSPPEVGNLATTPDPYGDASRFVSTIDWSTPIGTGTVIGWDSENKILNIDGVSGSFNTVGFTLGYKIENGSCSGVLYATLQPYIQPINNGVGTTAGINEEIDEEAELFDVDKNKPC
jgi:hypothetical protein